MKTSSTTSTVAGEWLCTLRTIGSVTALSACFIAIGCTTGELGIGSDSTRGPIVQTPTNFETALKQNQAALADRKGAPDLALYNIGLLLVHPANPKRDQTKAIQSFRTLVAEHPRSTYSEPAKTWIQVLEQQQKVTEERQKLTDEKQKLAEEKRALTREREMLVQERQKLNYANEKSQQLDLEIEKRRRQSLSR
jgi:hypothetical protein